MTKAGITERRTRHADPRTSLSHTLRLQAALADLSPDAVRRYQAAVLNKYPAARFATAADFGRIVAGDRLVSLPVPLIDPQAECLAWLDASERLGDGNQYNPSHGPIQNQPGPELATLTGKPAPLFKTDRVPLR